MTPSNTDLAREALTRTLEHHIEETCNLIIQTFTFIRDNSHVTVDNFELMVKAGTSIEYVYDSSIEISAFIKNIKIAEKILPAVAPLPFKIE